MRVTALFTAAILTFGLAALEADAAKRFGGGGNVGKQRSAPTKSEAAPASTPAATPATPAAAPAAAGAAGGAAAAAKPSFMSRWGGLLAGLGIGAVLASLFGASMGPIVGMLLAALLVGGIVFFLFRMFAARGNPAPASAGIGGQAPSATGGPRAAFSGIGSGVPGGSSAPEAPVEAAPAPTTIRPNFDVDTFLRGAKTSFIRLQAASDAKDLDDIRDYTTPELYAEISMQITERGDEPQRTEVVSVDARLLDVAAEDGYDIVSVRFTGLIRENDARNPEPFDEIWHVRKKIGERKPAWLISGIQQVAE